MSNVSVRDIRSALSTVKPAVPRSNRIDVLKHVRIDDERSITATDLETVIRTAFPVDLPEGSSLLIRFADLVAALRPYSVKDSVDLVATESTLTIAGKYGTATLQAYPDGDKWPRLPDFFPAGAESISLHPSFRDEVLSLIPFVSRDESRPALTGVFYDGYTLVATDSYRMGWQRHELSSYAPGAELQHASLLFRPQALKSLPVGEAISLYEPNRQWIVFQAWNTTVSVRRIDASFPSWQGLLPAYGAVEVAVDLPATSVEVFAAAGKQVLRNQPVRVSVNGSVEVASIDGGFRSVLDGSRIAWIAPEGEVAVGVNSAYAADCLRFVGDVNRRVEIISPLRPLLFGDRVCRGALLMPVRLPE